MTATAGGRCLDVAVCTFSHPANLRRLAKAFVRLLGQRLQTHTVTKTHLEVRNVLIFTHSAKQLMPRRGGVWFMPENALLAFWVVF